MRAVDRDIGPTGKRFDSGRYRRQRLQVDRFLKIRGQQPLFVDVLEALSARFERVSTPGKLDKPLAARLIFDWLAVNLDLRVGR